MKKLNILLLSLFLLISVLQTQETNLFCLEDCAEKVLKRNLDIRNAELSFQQNRLDEIKTISAYIPKAGITWSDNNIDDLMYGSPYQNESSSLAPSLTFALPGGSVLSYEYSALDTTVPYEFYTRKKTLSFRLPLLQGMLLVPFDINIIRMASSSRELARLGIIQTAEGAVFQTYLTYFNLEISRLNIEAKERSLERSRILLSKNEGNRSLGIVESSDLSSLRAALAMKNSDLLYSKSQEQDLINNLRNLMNIDSDFIVEKDGELFDREFAGIGTNYEALVRSAFSNRAELKSLHAQERLLRLQLQNVKSGILPRLDLTGMVSSMGSGFDTDAASDSLSNNEHPSWNLGLSLSTPLFPAGQIAEAKKTSLELEKTRNMIQKTEDGIRRSIRLLLDNVRNAQARLKKTEAAIKFQEETLKEEERKFRTGQSSNYMLITRQGDLDSAETMHLQTMLNYYMSLLSLEYAKGTLLKTHHADYYERIQNL